MSSQLKTVWVWLPGQTHPIIAGRFEIQIRAGQPIGSFVYDPTYVAHATSFSLDPAHLVLNHKRPDKKYETRLNKGLFGVFRDVCPEGYGRDLLNYRFGREDEPLSDMDLLEKSVGDSVGAIEICDDIKAKLDSSVSPSLSCLVDALSDLSPERAASHAVHRMYEIGTSMGGERPKLTVHDDDSQWLAKLQDRGDAPHMPARENVAMRLGRLCGLNAAEVRFIRTPNQHELVLVKRFDRLGIDGQRIPYLSAHTALGLDIGTLPGHRSRSYLALADRGRRMGVGEEDIKEIWKRMAFNALINNVDDHPRNHGFVRVDGQWRLAPAFDLVPLLRKNDGIGPVLAMSVTRSGERQAGVTQLLESSRHFGLEPREAAAWLIESASTINDRWLAEMLQAGVSGEFCTSRQIASFTFAKMIASSPELTVNAADHLGKGTSGVKRQSGSS